MARRWDRRRGLTEPDRSVPFKPMLPPPIFFTLLALCWIYALLRGGKAERVGTTIMVFGSALTWAAAVGSVSRFASVEVGILIVDVAAFVAFAILAVRADRFWPIWVSALAGLGVLGHLARWYGGAHVTPGAYVVSLVIWSYVILAIIAVGTLNHQRRATRRLGGFRDRRQAET